MGVRLNEEDVRIKDRYLETEIGKWRVDKPRMDGAIRIFAWS